MTKGQDLSNFAAFDLDDLLAEIAQSNSSKKEVTAYLDRTFLVNMINEYHNQTKENEADFTLDKKIDITEYNFTGADFRNIAFNDFALFDFRECDLTAVKLDRVGINFFREPLSAGKITAQGLNLEGAYLGPLHTVRHELGVDCYMYLNLSNLDLSGTNFNNTNIQGLILENTKIGGCTFINCTNLDPKQFAFTINFETATFSKDQAEDEAIKEQIKKYSTTLDPATYDTTSYPKLSGFAHFLSKFGNSLDD